MMKMIEAVTTMAASQNMQSSQNATMVAKFSEMTENMRTQLQPSAPEKPLKLHPHIVKELTALQKRFEKNVYAYVKSSKRLEKAKKDFAGYSEGKLPENVKEIKFPDDDHLVKAWSKTKHQPYTVKIEVPPNTSLRDAQELIHLSLHKQLKEIDLEFLHLQEEEAKKLASESFFKEAAADISVPSEVL